MTTASSIQLRRRTSNSSSNTQALVVAATSTVVASAVASKNNNVGHLQDSKKYKKFIEQKEREDFLHKLKEFHKLKW